MGRILAIDYGGKRTGLAVTDELQMIAGGLTTVDTKELMDFLIQYCEKEKVEKIVIGMPVRHDGSPSDIATEILNFIKKLEKKLPQIPVLQHDERFTSKMAVKAMLEGGLKKKKRSDKKMIDKVSAVLILQSFMK